MSYYLLQANQTVADVNDPFAWGGTVGIVITFMITLVYSGYLEFGYAVFDASFAKEFTIMENLMQFNGPLKWYGFWFYGATIAWILTGFTLIINRYATFTAYTDANNPTGIPYAYQAYDIYSFVVSYIFLYCLFAIFDSFIVSFRNKEKFELKQGNARLNKEQSSKLLKEDTEFLDDEEKTALNVMYRKVVFCLFAVYMFTGFFLAYSSKIDAFISQSMWRSMVAANCFIIAFVLMRNSWINTIYINTNVSVKDIFDIKVWKYNRSFFLGNSYIAIGLYFLLNLIFLIPGFIISAIFRLLGAIYFYLPGKLKINLGDNENKNNNLLMAYPSYAIFGSKSVYGGYFPHMSVTKTLVVAMTLNQFLIGVVLYGDRTQGMCFGFLTGLLPFILTLISDNWNSFFGFFINTNFYFVVIVWFLGAAYPTNPNLNLMLVSREDIVFESFIQSIQTLFYIFSGIIWGTCAIDLIKSDKFYNNGSKFVGELFDIKLTAK